MCCCCCFEFSKGGASFVPLNRAVKKGNLITDKVTFAHFPNLFGIGSNVLYDNIDCIIKQNNLQYIVVPERLE